MAQNIIVSIFEVESEAYQAFTTLKQEPYTEKSFLKQAILVKKENGAVQSLDYFDTGAETTDNTAIGGLTGALVALRKEKNEEFKSRVEKRRAKMKEYFDDLEEPLSEIPRY